MNVDSVQFALGWVMRNAVFTIVIWDSRCGVESSRWTGRMRWDGGYGMEWAVGGGGCDVSNESRCSFEPRCLAGVG